MNWSNAKLASLLMVGPLGCYIAYQQIFVLKFLDVDLYPNLTLIYDQGGYAIDAILLSLVLLVSVFLIPKFANTVKFEPKNNRLSLPILMLFTLLTLVLLALNVYRILGTLSLAVIIQEFDNYYYYSTNGSAWMILLCYTGIYIILIDMYFCGVSKSNITFCLLNTFLVSMNGGRSLPILFVVALLVMLLCQRVTLKYFVTAGIASIFTIVASYGIATELRAPSGKQAQNLAVKPADDFYALNYNAAFILDDVLRRLETGQLVPRAFAAEDAINTFIPRQLFPAKPKSTAETIEVYPNVAARGTNIAFPLKANILMHLGGAAFYLDWIVVLVMQLLFFVGLRLRNTAPSIIGFGLVFWGCAFSLIARGGIFNSRLLVQLACITLGYLVYRYIFKVAVVPQPAVIPIKNNSDLLK